MRNLATLALTLAAGLGMAHAAIAPQQPLTTQPTPSGTHITVRKSAHLRRTPEIATMRYRSTAQATAKAGLDDLVDVQLRAFNADLAALPSATILPWSRRGRAMDANAERFDIGYIHSPPGSVDPLENATEKWQAWMSGKAQFESRAAFEAARDLVRETPGMQMERVQWGFTDDTVDGVREELVGAVLRSCARSGEGWARVLGGERARVVALEEEELDTGDADAHFGWPFEEMDEVWDYAEVDEVVMTLSARCTVVAE